MASIISSIMATKTPSWLKNVLSVRFRTVGLQTPLLAEVFMLQNSDIDDGKRNFQTRVN